MNIFPGDVWNTYIVVCATVSVISDNDETTVTDNQNIPDSLINQDGHESKTLPYQNII